MQLKRNSDIISFLPTKRHGFENTPKPPKASFPDPENSHLKTHPNATAKANAVKCHTVISCRFV